MDHDPRELLAIFIGGALGALLRATCVVALSHAGTGWPWTTFTLNLAGTFVLGYAATRLQERLPISTYRRPFIGTGFCGALTTFSTFQVETLRMLQHGDGILAAAYMLVSLGTGFLTFMLAVAVVRHRDLAL